MATAEELLNSVLKNEASVLSATDAVFVIDGESRTINVPDSERLFGVEGDKDVERKYFQCPKIVGDNIDLSQHQIYVSYAFTTTENSTSFPDADGLYHCEDVEVSGDNITFSWLLSGNVFANPGFIAFKVMAKKSEGEELKTKWNTAPAIGSVLLTVPDGEEIAEEYPDIINQLLTKMESVEQIATPEAMQGYVNAYLEKKPVTGGMTAEQERQLEQNTTDVADLKSALPNKLDTNQGVKNKGKSMVVGEDGELVPENVKVPVDKTLTQENEAADAKITGEKIKLNSYDFKNFKTGEFKPDIEFGNIAFGNVKWTYTSNATRYRTPEGYELKLKKGSIIKLESYENARFCVGCIQENEIKYYTSWMTSDYITETDGNFAILISTISGNEGLENLPNLLFVKNSDNYEYNL